MNIDAFHKMRDYQEREKDERQSKYQSGVEAFEAKATTLYNLLKEKEQMETTVEDELSGGMVNLYAVQHYQQAIQRVEEEVKRLQPEVQDARQRMYKLEQQRDEAYIEVKKYEKIIDRKTQELSEWMRFEEAKDMDAISIQQFSNKVTR
ncbi:flagellar export protein FliJ [Salimicrobium flavidum]|uniref:Flagellar FliJ protein n=1 Tax=Salimicrobium flavidum TaxID=570947 RepID=A0A1N7IKM4_9BACI|nr:flagellar export protein FliJ [Salimicrobium flavidum]SIS37643.1 flagellar FliJ protein [Salimicrobium flavidum]